MKKSILFFFALTLVGHVGICQSHDEESDKLTANESMLQNSHENLAKIFDSSERDQWQKPEEVIKFLGEIENKTIVDVGSGSGYFSFRLVRAGAKVIAADIDPAFLEMIEKKRKELEITNEVLNTIRIDEDNLNIEDGSADIIFLVNSYHHISDRINYFSAVNAKLKEGGKIVIVDFYKKSLPVGPPKNHKIAKEVVLEELDKAGFKDITTNLELLEYQYIITVNKY